jgi:hypothetical protein
MAGLQNGDDLRLHDQRGPAAAGDQSACPGKAFGPQARVTPVPLSKSPPPVFCPPAIVTEKLVAAGGEFEKGGGGGGAGIGTTHRDSLISAERLGWRRK